MSKVWVQKVSDGSVKQMRPNQALVACSPLYVSTERVDFDGEVQRNRVELPARHRYLTAEDVKRLVPHKSGKRMVLPKVEPKAKPKPKPKKKPKKSKKKKGKKS